MKYTGTLEIDPQRGTMYFLETDGPMIVRVLGLDDLVHRDFNRNVLTTMSITAGLVYVETRKKK